MARTNATLFAGLACLLLATSASAADLATGNPMVKSIESIAFGPEGLLLIGDGRGAQVIAVHTGDVKPLQWGKVEIADLSGQVGGRLGTSADHWQSRLTKLSQGRLLGRFFAASRQRLREVGARLGLRRVANLGGCPAS